MFLLPRKVEAGSESEGEAAKGVEVAEVTDEEAGMEGLGADCTDGWGAKKDAADWGDGTGHSDLNGNGLECEEDRTLSP